MATTDYSLANTLPANVEAERSILGAVLLDNMSYHQAAEHLHAEDFSLDSHRRIYTRMVDLSESARSIDIITLAEELGRGRRSGRGKTGAPRQQQKKSESRAQRYYDSFSGEALADRIGKTKGWRQFALYRIVPQSGPMCVTFALSGIGEAWLDDVAIQVLEPPAAAAQR